MQDAVVTPRGEIAAKISRESIRILRDYTGRGPTRARTVINDELVAITMVDTLTKGEARLVELGRAEHVLTTRQEFQRAMENDLVALVEGEMGRKVIAFLSANHIDPDIAVESFVLEREKEPSTDGVAHG